MASTTAALAAPPTDFQAAREQAAYAISLLPADASINAQDAQTLQDYYNEYVIVGSCPS